MTERPAPPPYAPDESLIGYIEAGQRSPRLGITQAMTQPRTAWAPAGASLFLRRPTASPPASSPERWRWPASSSSDQMYRSPRTTSAVVDGLFAAGWWPWDPAWRWWMPPDHPGRVYLINAAAERCRADQS
jgi:hypothetical protein